MELRTDRLTKQFGQKIAIDRVSITMKEGVYGLLGANGAGKTTLMRLLCDIQRPASGEVFYNGRPIQEMGEEYRSLLGYLPQNFGYYPGFTASRFLLYMSSLKGLNKSSAVQRSLELLETVGLSEVKDKKISTFSGGMKQRLGIAQAMLNNPDILVLDEPTAGLDPKERVRFRNLISSFSKNKIVLLSTHIVSDIEYIADEIFVMKEGKMIHQGQPDQITDKIRGFVWECAIPAGQVEEWSKQYIIGNLKNHGESVTLRIVSEKKPALDAVMAEPTLEDLYLYYFNENNEKEGHHD